MNAHNNGNNREYENDGRDDFSTDTNPSEEYESIENTELRGVSEENSEQYDNEENRAARLQKAIETENASAYDDIDDYVFRQPSRRHRSGHHRHHRKGVFSRLASRIGIKRSHRRHRHHHKRMKRWKKILITVVSIILVLIIGSAASVFLMINIGRNSLVEGDINIIAPVDAESIENGMYIEYNGVKYQYNENVTSVLCMGIDRKSINEIDSGQGTGGGDADTIFVLTLDLESGRTNIINISRDTMAEIATYSEEGAYLGTTETQICLAYAYGDGKETSCNNQLAAVRKLLFNVPINSYLALDIDGIGKINDSVGGVTVTSPETIGSFKAGETYTLFGDDAESFVRSRSHATVEGNSLRMQRQKIFLESFANTVFDKTKSDITTPVSIFNEANPYLCTNIDAPKVAYLSVNAMRGNFQEFNIRTVEGETKQGKVYAEFYPDEDKLFKLILDIYYKPVG